MSPAQTAKLARWMGSVDEKLTTLTGNSEDTKVHREGLYKVMEALSLGVRDLANEVQALKLITAGHQELNATVLKQGMQLTQLSSDVVDLNKTADDYKERLAEVRGAGKLATWARNAAWMIATVIAALFGYLLRHQRTDMP